MNRLIAFIRAHDGCMAFNVGNKLFGVSLYGTGKGAQWVTEELEPTPAAVRAWLGY